LQEGTNQQQKSNWISARGVRRLSVFVFWSLIALYVPLCMALLALKWWVLPDIDRHRPAIQSFLQEQTGLPVTLGALSAQWQGLSPQVVVGALSVPTPNGDAGFEAGQIRMDWSLPSFLAFTPRLNNLEIQSPRLLVERDLNGTLVVAGVRMVDDGTEGNPGLDWLLSQGRVWLSGGVVQWRDQTGKLPDARLENVQLLLENSLNRHQAGLKFDLPLLTQQPTLVQLDFKTPILNRDMGRVDQWKGSFYAQAALDQTQPIESVFKAFELDVDLTKPEGKVWLDFAQGAVQRTVFEAQVEQLRFANPAVDAVPFDMVNTSAIVEVQGSRSLLDPQAITVRQLTGHISGDRKFGPSDMAISRIKQAEGVDWGVQLTDLDAGQAKAIVTELAPHLGQADQLDTLNSFQFDGLLKLVNVRWQTFNNAPVSQALAFNSDIQFSNLTAQYRDDQPTGNGKVTGFKNLSGTLRGDNQAGQWTLNGNRVEVALPEVFANEVLAFDKVKGRGGWSNIFDTDKPVVFTLDELQVNNADLQAEVSGRYEFRREQPDVIDFKGSLPRADVAKVPNYLPLVVGENAREWLAFNLKAGTARQGEFAIRGNLDEFPFHLPDSDGLFRIVAPIENGQLTYAQGWPAITDISGIVRFEGKRMEIQAQQANTLGVALKNIQAEIPNLDAWEPMLSINGKAEGELASMVRFVNESPVQDILSDVLGNAQAQGMADLVLELTIPIADPEKTQVKGDLKLANNSIRLVEGMPWVGDVTGNIEFSNEGFALKQVQGQALGGPVALKGGTNATGWMDIRATGTARAKGLAQYLNPHLEPYLVGSTPYTVLVSNREQGLSVEVGSQFQGMEIKLPAPFEKKPEARLPFKLTQQINAQGERWAAELGPESKPIGQLRALVQDNNGQPNMEYLQFAIGTALGVPRGGVQGDIRMPVVELDVWRALRDEVVYKPGNKGLMGWALGLDEPVDGPPSRINVAIRTDALNVGSKSFEGVSVVAKTVEKRWQFDVKAKGVEGYISWVSDKQRPDGAVLARFKTLTIPKTLDDGIRDLVEEPASSIPELDVQAEQFTLNNMALGSLKLRAINQSREEQARATLTQKPREWKLEELRIENPESVTQAKGTWQYGSNLSNQRTDIEINQTVKNAGGLLARLGMQGVFRGGEGTLNGRLRWNDAPTNLDYGSLSGQFKLKSSNGQFLKADPGVAKLLGVLSLQSMPRRFALDFKDVFSEGFAYDTMEADVRLNEGIANTQNFKMMGPSATVLMDGDLDLESETQNLSVVVLPDLNATGGSLIYSVIAANPAVGIASLIADFVLKDPLSKIFSFQYQVTGPWVSPVIERVRRGDAVTPPTNDPNTRP
jgi:uncharacterized protein (TIGR02099 family)